MFFAAIMGGLALAPVGKTQLFFPINSVQAMETATPQQLQDTTWYISDWPSSPVPGSAPITLQFIGDRLSGTGGCNNFNGSYTGDGGSLTIGPALATTRKACAEEVMAQEQKFLQLLSQVTAYNIGNNGQLTLTYLGDGKEGTITFIPASQYSVLHNTQWQLVTMAGVEPLTNEATARMPQLEFLGDRLAGTGGCNRLMGQFTIDGEILTVDDRMASTMMACSEPLMEQEQQFIQALVNAQKYEILTSGELVIEYLNDGETKQLVFKALTVDGSTQENKNDQDVSSYGQSGQTDGVEKIIFVAPAKVACTGVAPMECLQIKEGNPDQSWKFHYGSIVGFEYEPGYYYQLRVLETTVPNPPADASAKTWTLVAVESKNPQ
ncbi:META and DUF4377 domain-containing protein [Synechocystis sp. CS-94]|nr:META and DUF4377 domain-containing protein [Synechocystis sp. CS-94]